MIEEILTLRPEIIATLRESFDMMSMETFLLDDGMFIGVHVPDAPTVYEIKERRGYWCYGRFLCS